VQAAGLLDHADIGAGIGTNTHAQIDTHIADTANPHATDLGNLGAGTLSDLNAAVADATLHDTHTGDVTGGAALTIADDAVTYAKIQNVVADDVILGNVGGAGGIVDELTATEVRTLINVEDGADVTDTTNVTAAGALMDSEVDADIKTLTLPASTTISTYGATLVDDADAATARATLDVDPSGTDNSTDVTLAGEDYLSIDGSQVVTAAAVDLSGTHVTGELPTANIENSAVTYAKIQNVVADNVILGNVGGAGGIVDELTGDEVTDLLTVDDSTIEIDPTNGLQVVDGGISNDQLLDQPLATFSQNVTDQDFIGSLDSRLTDARAADEIETSGTNVTISATAPTANQVLKATSATAASWQTIGGGDADALSTTGASVDVSAAAPPTTGQILKATSATTATWQTGGGAATDLATSGSDVAVDSTAPAAANYILKSTGTTVATWQLDTSNIATGVAASRPSADGSQGFYYATDTQVMSYDDASTWEEVGVPADDVTIEVDGTNGLQVKDGGIDLDQLAGTPTALYHLRSNATNDGVEWVSHTLQKSLSVEDPVTDDEFTMFYTHTAITCDRMAYGVQGSSTPTVPFTLYHGTIRNVAGTAMNTGTTVSAGAAQTDNTWTDDTVPANSFVWVELGTVTGVVDEFYLTLDYTED